MEARTHGSGAARQMVSSTWQRKDQRTLQFIHILFGVVDHLMAQPGTRAGLGRGVIEAGLYSGKIEDTTLTLLSVALATFRTLK